MLLVLNWNLERILKKERADTDLHTEYKFTRAPRHSLIMHVWNILKCSELRDGLNVNLTLIQIF